MAHDHVFEGSNPFPATIFVALGNRKIWNTMSGRFFKADCGRYVMIGLWIGGKEVLKHYAVRPLRSKGFSPLDSPPWILLPVWVHRISIGICVLILGLS